jgi:hypothetical protein
LTRLYTSLILRVLRGYGFARSSEGTETQGVRKDRLGSLFVRLLIVSSQ